MNLTDEQLTELRDCIAEGVQAQYPKADYIALQIKAAFDETLAQIKSKEDPREGY